jgi:hypothetical protein
MRVVRELLLRSPAFLLVCLCLFISREQSGQIAALFEIARSAGQILLPIGIAAAAAAAMAVFTPRSGMASRALDILLVVTPALCLSVAFQKSPAQGTVLSLLILVAMCAVAWFATRFTLASNRAILAGGAAIVVLFLTTSRALLLDPVENPRALGSISIVLMFVGLCLFGLTLMIRRPWVGSPVFVGLAILLGTYEGKHAIRQTDQTNYENPDVSTSATRASVSLEQGFNEWLTSRNDLGSYLDVGNPYPIFIVTSEGGGGYAAAHAELFLSKLQAKCPNFAQHLFALVGVSGGAVGNALFQAALPNTVNEPREYKECSVADVPERVVDTLASDHLSPVLAAALFQDLPNNLSHGAFGPYDRSEALGDSLSRAIWNAPANRGPLFWNSFWLDAPPAPGQTLGERPALIFASTNATSGKRYVFAPFVFPFNDYRSRFEEFVLDMNWNDEGKWVRQEDIEMVDAAVAAASFPWVTPSRALSGRDNDIISLVDGGYLDNSGAETARDVVAAITNMDRDTALMFRDDILPPKSLVPTDRFTGCDRVIGAFVPRDGTRLAESFEALPDKCTVPFSVHVIAIRSEVPFERATLKQSFLFDPLTALLSARARRAETARFGLVSELCGALECDEADVLATWQYYESVIALDYLNLPLGWHIPRSRLAKLSTFVAPEPNADFSYLLPDDVLWQQMGRPFSNMSDNPFNMGQIEAALAPNP